MPFGSMTIKIATNQKTILIYFEHIQIYSHFLHTNISKYQINTEKLESEHIKSSD
jgi:hypothetical protein